MRFSKVATILAWAAAFAFAASSTWTVRNHLVVRERVYRDTSTARAILQDTSGSDSVVTVVGGLDKLKRGQATPTGHTTPTKTARHYAIANAHFPQGFVQSPGATRAHHLQSRPKVWLYALFNTNYDGSQLAPHFARHYTGMGVHASMMYVDLLHDPALADDGLRKAQRHLQELGAHTRSILQPYSSAVQDVAMISGLAHIPMKPDDWIIVADMDEFYTFGNHSSVQAVAQAMEDDGASFALGEMLDHVAPDGALNHVCISPDIWSQFPLICPVIATIGKGLAAKVTMHKAYLRSGPGHHYIVEPYLAEAYFGSNCTGLACEIVMKRFKQRSAQDVFKYTPYKDYPHLYAKSVNASGWQAQRWQTWTKIHHFKWSSTVLENLQARMVRDSGDCLLGINENNCQPVFQFWQEVARQYQNINAIQRIDVTDLKCKEGIDTQWNWTTMP